MSNSLDLDQADSSGLILVQTVCQGYQQTTLVDKELRIGFFFKARHLLLILLKFSSYAEDLIRATGVISHSCLRCPGITTTMNSFKDMLMVMLHAVSVLVVFGLTMGSIRHINAASKASKVVGLSLCR